jgi:hypothetical protein
MLLKRFLDAKASSASTPSTVVVTVKIGGKWYDEEGGQELGEEERRSRELVDDAEWRKASERGEIRTVAVRQERRRDD